MYAIVALSLGRVTNVWTYLLQELLRELAEVTDGCYHGYSSTAEVFAVMCDLTSICRF